MSNPTQVIDAILDELQFHKESVRSAQDAYHRDEIFAQIGRWARDNKVVESVLECNAFRATADLGFNAERVQKNLGVRNKQARSEEISSLYLLGLEIYTWKDEIRKMLQREQIDRDNTVKPNKNRFSLER